MARLEMTGAVDRRMEAVAVGIVGKAGGALGLASLCSCFLAAFLGVLELLLFDLARLGLGEITGNGAASETNGGGAMDWMLEGRASSTETFRWLG